jgi:hypothetical protein
MEVLVIKILPFLLDLVQQLINNKISIFIQKINKEITIKSKKVIFLWLLIENSQIQRSNLYLI